MFQKTAVLKLIPGLMLGALSTMAGHAGASGFQLLEQNASGIGNAFAGSAAVAEDASTVFFNPAGMSLLPAKRHFSVSLDMVRPQAKFSNDGSTAPLGITRLGGDGGDAGGWEPVPAAYFVMPINERWTFGMGVGAPFGLATDYDKDWRGRFHATKSSVKTINFNPSVSYRLNDQVALGFGANYQKLDAQLASAANVSAALCANPALAALCGAGALNDQEATVRVKGSDWTWGYNLGAIIQLSQQTRLGLAYRSSVKYHVTGSTRFDKPTIAAGGLISAGTAAFLNGSLAASTTLADGPVKLDIELPDTFTLSLTHRLDERWELLGDLAWTGWAKIQSLDIYRSNGTLLSTTPEHWRNTLRLALGANYQLDPATKLRLGLAYDQSPVDQDDYRTPRLPDHNRTWLSIGAQYKLTADSMLDVGYAHLFINKASIHDNGHSAANQASRGLLSGSYDNAVDILGIQYSLAF
ncbi:OmpP1/FadL family transporter [Denitratisoma oestradiolicum]|uniref:Putative long-chain fatty acid transport protein n=1 Tax=Denitratisoma oestradiolicum TaxID=311182 RepID=A0A6S6XY45_9PROT|nr:outer membrane protein transport protein [Denitratisoma oestradiolicum]TWO80773.1 hypothetical protein CBW56_08400 [Denitratisoma oestradiolicum]CAB1370914.1 putative long-chain fatty acid transport protein [Denitratisoma oestradiolicum]